MTVKVRTTILVIDDDEAVRLYMKNLLANRGDILVAADEQGAMEILSRNCIDIVLLDLVLSDGSESLSLLKRIRGKNDDIDVIIVSGIRDVKTVVDAMRDGATDYLNKPINKDELLLTLERVLSKRALRKQNQVLKEELVESSETDEVVGISKSIIEIKAMITRLKGQEANVLLVGETGTGKEVFARLLHRQEEDPSRPFVSVNCAAIPQELLESVLFGHEKGAFTGAIETRAGKFELANGGDIFLDEISCLPSMLQAKLLRVLEEKEVERVGGKAARKISFRVISASNEDLVKKVSDGTFRSDLYYRLNTVSVQLPPLRERREDIIILAEHFLQKYKRGATPKVLSPEAKEILEGCDWKGNVRELRNTVENMIIFSKGNVIEANDVPITHSPSKPPVAAGETAAYQSTGNYNSALQQFEKELFINALQKNRWSKTRTSKEMGISRNKLYRKLSELGIE